jgi:recombination protein RecA
VRKSGAYYTYGGEQVGQGKQNAARFLQTHGDIGDRIEAAILAELSPVARAEAGAEAEAEALG